MKHLFFLISLFFVFHGFSQTYRISGKETYEYDGNLSTLAGATVYLESETTTLTSQGSKNFSLQANSEITVKLMGNVGVEDGRYNQLKIELTHLASQKLFETDILNNRYEFSNVSVGKSVLKVMDDLVGIVGMDTIDIQDNGNGEMQHNLVLAQTKIKVEGQILDAQGSGFNNANVLLIVGSDTIVKTMTTYTYNPQYTSGVYSAFISKGGNVRLEASYTDYPTVDSTFGIKFDSLINVGAKLLTLPTLKLLPQAGRITTKFKTVVYEDGNATNVEGVHIYIFSANQDTLAKGISDVEGMVSLSFTGYLNMSYNYLAVHSKFELVNGGVYIDSWESSNLSSIYLNKRMFNVVNFKVEKAPDTLSSLISWGLDPLASEYTVEKYIVQRYNGNYYEPIAEITVGNPLQYIDKNVQSTKTYCYIVDVQYAQGRSNLPTSLAECVTFVDYPVYKVYGLAKGRDYSDHLTAISNVKIILKNENQLYETYTDYNGNYTFFAVIPGEYTLSVLASIQGSIQKYSSSLVVIDANVIKNFNTEKDDKYFEYNVTIEEKGSNGNRLNDVIIDYFISSDRSTLSSTLTQYGSAYLFLMKDSIYTVYFSKQGYDTLMLNQKFTSEVSYATYQLQPNLGETIDLKGSVNSTTNEFDGIYVELTNIESKRTFRAPILDNAYEFEGISTGKSVLKLSDEVLGIVGVDTIEVLNPGNDIMTLNLTIAQIRLKVYGFVKDAMSNYHLNDVKVYMIKGTDTILSETSSYKSLNQEPWSYQGYYECLLTQGGSVRLLAKKEGYAMIDTTFVFPFNDLIAAKTKEFALPMLMMQGIKGDITAIFQTVSYNTSTYAYDTVVGANLNLSTPSGEIIASGVSDEKGFIYLNFNGYLNFEYKQIVSHPLYDTIINNNQIFSVWNSSSQQLYLYKKSKIIYTVTNLQAKDTLSGKALISWDLHKEAEDYTVFRYQVLKKDAEGNFVGLAYVMAGEALQYIDNTVEKGQNYCYVVDVYYSNPTGVGYYTKNDAVCVSIPLDTCPLPTTLVTSSITDSSAVLTWTSISPKFEVLVYENSVLLGDTLKLSVNTTSLYNLKENTTYTWKVRSLENGKISSAWASVNFTTLKKALDTCPLPTTLVTSSITDSSAVLTWTSTSSNFEVLVYENSVLLGDTLKLSVNTTSLYNLKENTTYTWKVKSLENGKISSAWANSEFTTTKKANNSLFETRSLVQAYPNPTQGNLSLDLGQMETNVNIEIQSNTGEILNRYTFKNIQKIDLDLSRYVKGMYIIKIQTNYYHLMKKVVKG